MAFNPFNIFRRNQRIIFAVVTVFVMFTFVLSSGMTGGADFFEWLPNWLGSKSRKGDALFEIEGKKVYSRDLSEVRTQRILANQYMSLAANFAISNLSRDIDTKLGKVSRDRQRLFETTLSTLRQSQNRQSLIAIQDEMRRLANDKTTKSEDADVARDLWVLSSLLSQRIGAPHEMYFTSVPNRTDSDLVEFLLWEKKAGQLGIQFNEADVKRLVADEFLGRLGSAEVDVRKEVLSHRQISDSRLWAALNNEFRVRMAQVTVLGNENPRANGTLSPPPVYATPFDLFTYYKDNFSTTNYEVLSVPVANFVDQVTEKPTDAELQKLFQEHQGVEPSPGSDRPGFKEPRKAKLQWISATGKEPYYVSAAREWLKTSELQAKLGLLMTVPVPSVGPVWATSARLLIEPELALEAPYGAVRQLHQSTMDLQYTGRAFNHQVLDTSLVSPANLASLVGGVAGSALTGAPSFFTAANLIDQASRDQERRTRIKVGLPLVLGSVPTPGLFGTGLAAVAASQAAHPQPLPLGAYKAELNTKMLELLAHNLMTRDLQKFSDEVERLTKDVRDPSKKKAAVASYIEDFVRTRGLKQGETADFRDEYTVGDDASLAPLKEIMDKAPHGTQPVRFGRQFFNVPYIEKAFKDPTLMQSLMQAPQDQQQDIFRRLQMMPDVPDSGVFQPRPYPNRPGETPGGDPAYLVWRTEEKAPQTVTFRVAEPKVLAAWKKNKARELAQKEAERLAEEIRSKNANNPTQVMMYLKDLETQLKSRWPDPKAADRVKEFVIPEVAKFQVRPNFQNPMQSQVRPFQLEANSNIPFPNAEMTKKLLDERTKPISTTFLMSDQPKDTFYVATLASRTEKQPSDFQRDVSSAPATSQVRQAVTQEQREEALRKMRESALALLKVEFKYANENTEKLNEGDKRASE